MELDHRLLIDANALNRYVNLIKHSEDNNYNVFINKRYEVCLIFHYILFYGELSTLKIFMKLKSHKQIYLDKAFLTEIGACIVKKLYDKVDYLLSIENIKKDIPFALKDRHLKPIYIKYLRIKKLKELKL